MMRPDDLSRPMNDREQQKRLPGTTLDLARQYLKLTRKATRMWNKKVFGPFKSWRRKRLERKADQLQEKAAEVWGELWLRFRPLCSNAFARASVLHGPGYSEAGFLNRMVAKLEEGIGRDASNACFADLLWKALEAAAAPHASAFKDLHRKVHARAVVDSCTSEEASVRTIVLLAYLRGEIAMKAGHAIPDLSDLEKDDLRQACQAVGSCMRQWGDDLDSLTAGALSSRAWTGAKPGDVVLAWIR